MFLCLLEYSNKVKYERSERQLYLTRAHFYLERRVLIRNLLSLRSNKFAKEKDIYE